MLREQEDGRFAMSVAGYFNTLRPKAFYAKISFYFWDSAFWVYPARGDLTPVTHVFFSARMSSQVASLFEGVVSQVSAGTELSRMVSPIQRERILRGLFDSYYDEEPADVIFDTNRAWTAKLPDLMTLFPDAKFVCCVRDVSWVMDSLERQFRLNFFENTGLFGDPNERATVYTRTEALVGPNRLVGYAYQALREASWGPHADRLVIIDYDIFATRPVDVIDLIYDFLGEEKFEHDFESVEYDAPAFDAQLGIDGLHRVRPKVAHEARKTILPPDVFDKYAKLAFWRDLKNCAAFRIVAKPNDPK